MSEELSKKIAGWLAQHGYPFEMYVSSVFQKYEFEIAQSVLYVDQDTSIAREIDIIAHKSFLKKGVTVSFAVIIECKANKDKPWVAFLANNDSDITLKIKNHHATADGIKFLDFLNKNRRNWGALGPLFPNGIKTFAYSITQAFRPDNEGPDIPYKAIQTINKSLNYFIEKLDKRGKSITFYFPVIAVDNPIFQAELLPTNEIEIKEVAQSTFVGRQTKEDNEFLIIDIINRSMIDHYAKKIKDLIADFLEAHEEHLDLFVEDYYDENDKKS